MGMDLTTRLTPYIETPRFIEKMVDKVKRYCPDHPKIKQEKSKFCSECGDEIINEDYQEKSKIYPYQILREIEDYDYELYSGEGMDNIFIPNSYPPKNLRIGDDGGAFEIEDPSEIKETQVKWFEAKYSKEIEVLKSAFGEDKVQVKWGIVSYWS